MKYHHGGSLPWEYRNNKPKIKGIGILLGILCTAWNWNYPKGETNGHLKITFYSGGILLKMVLSCGKVNNDQTFLHAQPQ